MSKLISLSPTLTEALLEIEGTIQKSSQESNGNNRPNEREKTMGNPDLDYANFAYLNDEDIPVLCSRKEARESYNGQRCSMKHDDVAGWRIYTDFNWFSLEPDAPMFCQVSWWHESKPFSGLGKERHFGTKEAALQFHSDLMVRLLDEQAGPGYSDSPQYLEDAEDDPHDRDDANWWKE